MGATVLMGAGQLDPCPVELICPALLGTFASSLGGGGGSLLRDKHTVNVDLAPLSSPPAWGLKTTPPSSAAPLALPLCGPCLSTLSLFLKRTPENSAECGILEFIQLHGPALPLASRPWSCAGPDGKTARAPHLRAMVPGDGGGEGWEFQPRGFPWTSLQEVVSLSGLLVLSQTPLVLVSIRISFYTLFCGWLAASPCPLPILPLSRQVSWLATIPTVAPYHLSDIGCPGREQGSSACTWCLARVPLADPGGAFSFSLSAGRPAWFLGDLGPQEIPSYTCTFCLEPTLALLKSFHVF